MKPAALFGSVRRFVLTASFCPASCLNDWHGGAWEATTFYGIEWDNLGFLYDPAPPAWDRRLNDGPQLQDVGRRPKFAAKYGWAPAGTPQTATCVRNATLRRDISRTRRFSVPAHDSAPDPASDSRSSHAVAWRPMPRDGGDGLSGRLPHTVRRAGGRKPCARGSNRSRSAVKSVSSLRGCQKLGQQGICICCMAALTIQPLCNCSIRINITSTAAGTNARRQGNRVQKALSSSLGFL